MNKKHNLFQKNLWFFLLLGIVIFTVTAAARSRAPEEISSTPAIYDGRALAREIDRQIQIGATDFSAVYASSETLENEIIQTLKNTLSSNYLCSCLLNDIDAACHRHHAATRVDFTLQYAGEGPFGPIAKISSRSELENTLLTEFSKSWNKVPILLKNIHFSEEELFSSLNNVEVNCSSLPCEASEVYYTAYDAEKNQQFLLFWMNFAADTDHLEKRKQELSLAVSKQTELIRGEQPTDPRSLYRHVFQLIQSDAKYDDELAAATLAGGENLTEMMHVNRSAYGALITGSTVCTGYARGFKSICDSLGLPCWVLIGTYLGEDHAWNAVKLDGQTLYVDCTLSDTQNNGDEFFLFTDEQAHSYGYIPASCSRIPWQSDS